jgi:dihydrofolate reductase
MVSWDDPLFKNKQCFVFAKNPTNTNKNVKFVNQDITSFVCNLKHKEGVITVTIISNKYSQLCFYLVYL